MIEAIVVTTVVMAIICGVRYLASTMVYDSEDWRRMQLRGMITI